MGNLPEKLISKSIEAFIMGLEVYNKPTIRYRVEGFAFFICNAWELMLKAKLIKDKGEQSIYFKNKPDRTIDLNFAIRLVFTNDKDPLRKNLERIISLRNVSTHFITDDYERIYAPLFQACVSNYSNKLLEFHGEDITDKIPQNFLTLSLSLTELTDQEIQAKYSPEIAQKFILQRNDLAVTEQELSNPKFSIEIGQNLYITKDRNKADFFVAVDRNADAKGTIIKEIRDPQNTHNYSFSNLVDAVDKRIQDGKIPFTYLQPNGLTRNNFTKGDLTLFLKFYGMKDDIKYAYRHHIGKSEPYSYSVSAMEFIIGAIKKEPTEIIDKIKKALAEQNKNR